MTLEQIGRKWYKLCQEKEQEILRLSAVIGKLKVKNSYHPFSNIRHEAVVKILLGRDDVDLNKPDN